jgi:hypothetical protein
MKFGKGIGKKYRESIEDAFKKIYDKDTDFHRRLIENSVDSKMLVRTFPVSKA